jgi:hypothetical protein
VQVVVPEKNGHRSLAAAVETHLEEIKLTKKPKTHSSYSIALSYFMESCHKPNLEDIDRLELLKFIAFLRDEKEHAARTIAGKFNAVMIFLRAGDTWSSAQKRPAKIHPGAQTTSTVQFRGQFAWPKLYSSLERSAQSRLFTILFLILTGCIGFRSRRTDREHGIAPKWMRAGKE